MRDICTKFDEFNRCKEFLLFTLNFLICHDVEICWDNRRKNFVVFDWLIFNGIF